MIEFDAACDHSVVSIGAVTLRVVDVIVELTDHRNCNREREREIRYYS